MENRKTYVFYHVVNGFTEKLYHADTSCGVVVGAPQSAKRYEKTPKEAEEQQSVIRKNFEYVFKEAPGYAAYEIWHGKPVTEIQTFYEEFIPLQKK